MSAQQKAPAKAKRRGIGEIVKGGPPIVGLTAYTAPIAGLLDPHVDFLLVGDSLGMVVYGFDSTLPVTVEMMVAHGAAVTRATARALVVVDLPFGGYQESPEQAFRNAARIMALTGCAAVKLEGGAEMAETVRFLVRRGVPVMGHVGLMPQRVNTAGGFKVQGRGEEPGRTGRRRRRRDRRGRRLRDRHRGHHREGRARHHREALPVPTIGIGASPACDGQILVTDDVLGVFTEFTPRFVKRYAELAPLISAAAEAYAADVRARRFPGPEHCFGKK